MTRRNFFLSLIAAAGAGAAATAAGGQLGCAAACGHYVPEGWVTITVQDFIELEVSETLIETCFFSQPPWDYDFNRRVVHMPMRDLHFLMAERRR